jgi:hypothetical protein
LWDRAGRADAGVENVTRGWLNHVCGHSSAKPASAVRSDAWLEDELDDAGSEPGAAPLGSLPIDRSRVLVRPTVDFDRESLARSTSSVPCRRSQRHRQSGT